MTNEKLLLVYIAKALYPEGVDPTYMTLLWGKLGLRNLARSAALACFARGDVTSPEALALREYIERTDK
jgi:hypothetical protein